MDKKDITMMVAIAALFAFGIRQCNGRNKSNYLESIADSNKPAAATKIDSAVQTRDYVAKKATASLIPDYNNQPDFPDINSGMIRSTVSSLYTPNPDIDGLHSIITHLLYSTESELKCHPNLESCSMGDLVFQNLGLRMRFGISEYYITKYNPSFDVSYNLGLVLGEEKYKEFFMEKHDRPSIEIYCRAADARMDRCELQIMLPETPDQEIENKLRVIGWKYITNPDNGGLYRFVRKSNILWRITDPADRNFPLPVGFTSEDISLMNRQDFIPRIFGPGHYVTYNNWLERIRATVSRGQLNRR